MEINFFAAFVASLAGPVIGTLWYSFLFAKPWQKYSGITAAEMKKSMPRIVPFSYLFTLLMSLNLAAFIGSQADGTFGLFAGFAAGFGWVSFAFAITYMFEHKPLKLFLINGGYFVVLLSLMGLIIGLF